MNEPTPQSNGAPTSVGAELPFSLYQRTLPNGLRVWCQPRPESTSLAALLVIQSGARFETPANNGISHFLEHMLFAGTERWDEIQIKEIISRRGGRWNGRTGRERTTYWVQLPAQDLDTAAQWLDQVAFHPTLPADKVDKERQVIFQERMGRYGWLINQLDALGFGYELDRNVRRAIFPDSTLSLRIAGEDASLEAIDRAALATFHRRHYTPANALWIVVGRADPDEVLAQAEAHFGHLTGDEAPSIPERPPLPDDGPQRVVVRGPLPTAQVRTMIGARTVGRDHPDYWPLKVLAYILQQDLMAEIRYRQGLVYSLRVRNVSMSDVGYLAVYTRSEKGRQEAIRQAVEKQLNQIRQGQLDEERIARVKTALQGRWTLSTEDNLKRARWLAHWARRERDDTIPNYLTALDAVAAEDLPRIVSSYFTPQRRYLGLHDPAFTVTSAATALGTALLVGLGTWAARRFWK